MAPTSSGENVLLLLVLVMFQNTVACPEVPLLITVRLMCCANNPVGSCTSTDWWAVAKPTSPLASSAVILMDEVCLIPSRGVWGGTWFIRSVAEDKYTCRLLSNKTFGDILIFNSVSCNKHNGRYKFTQSDKIQ